MKTISIAIRDEDHDDLISAEPGIVAKSYPVADKTVWGIPLGTVRLQWDEVPDNLKESYLRVRWENPDDSPYMLHNLDLVTTDSRIPYVTNHANDDMDRIAVYLRPSSPRVGAAFRYAKDLKFKKELFEGCHYSTVPVKRRDGTEFYPYSCPALLIAHVGQMYTILYWDIELKSRMELDLKFYYDDSGTVCVETLDHRNFVKQLPPHGGPRR